MMPPPFDLDTAVAPSGDTKTANECVNTYVAIPKQNAICGNVFSDARDQTVAGLVSKFSHAR